MPALSLRGPEGASVELGGEILDATQAFTHNTVASAVAGLPSAVVPCGLTKPKAGAVAGTPDAERLPVALEFVGLADRDEKVLALAAAFQRLSPLLTDPIQLRSWQKSVSLTNN